MIWTIVVVCQKVFEKFFEAQLMPQFKLRIDDDLHAAIKLSSEQHNRSVNSEIAHHLRAAMTAAGYLSVTGGGDINNVIAGTLPPGTVLTPHEIDKDDPRYTPYVRREEIQEVLDYIRQEMKNKKS
ncbi:Arc family DNA-binding protein [Aeromonas caviae]|jgi:hypothetical protein|uniref:TA system antitoxin ParD family protein n=1 Tax=Aeromonas TaxID=642 RepID=UPI0029B5B631|nr:Arc family DNA-binding protein [Aeromonas salmonicida]